MYTIAFRYLGELTYLTYEEHDEHIVFTWLKENAAKGLVTCP